MPEILEAEVMVAIRSVAYQASGNLKRFGYEQQDLSQELVLHYLRRYPQHDSARASAATFAACICRHRLISIFEAETACRRSASGGLTSLSEPVAIGQSGETIERGETISQDVYDRNAGRRSRPHAEGIELQIDISRVVASLPPHLANLARSLAFEPVTLAACDLGISRATAHRHLRELRGAFTEAGLDLYSVRRFPARRKAQEFTGVVSSNGSATLQKGGKR